jgi:hypothetical protein
MKTTTRLTKVIDGHTLLAKQTKYGIHAISYVNNAQAEKAAAKLRAEGVACWIWQDRLGPCRYIVLGS